MVERLHTWEENVKFFFCQLFWSHLALECHDDHHKPFSRCLSHTSERGTLPSFPKYHLLYRTMRHLPKHEKNGKQFVESQSHTSALGWGNSVVRYLESARVTDTLGRADQW